MEKNVKERKRYGLYFKWTVSRGANTYGYNICSLQVDGKKVASCNGGGYDMKGTSFANWLATTFQEELIKIGMQAHGFYPVNDKGKPMYEKKEMTDNIPTGSLYGMTSYLYIDEKKKPTVKKVMLDGGCGFSSITRIAEAIGFTVEFVAEVDNGGSVYCVKNY